MTGIFMLAQFLVTLIIGFYFYRQLKGQEKTEQAHTGSMSRDMDRLNRLRRVHLTRPLSEQVRPSRLEDIVGQEDGIKALKVLLFGPNPQHVILYGPPGVGKTAAARLVMEQAKRSQGTPFLRDAPFIEMDATCVRFDERAIADPLIGSVHDPIYQGAGQLGVSGVPQPKEGAVTRAHGGILFLDEIGELHPTQMNKLLKVLEDRMVRFESTYYNPEDSKTPRYIHEVFQNGLPADFRLVGATTRSPEELPPALRSRCMEVFFRGLEPGELAKIASDAARRAGFTMDEACGLLIGRHASGGRDAVNMVQMSAGLARDHGRGEILPEDVEWVIESGHYPFRPEQIRLRAPQTGRVNALAVQGAHQGMVMEIEATARPAARVPGAVEVTGIADSEELGQKGNRSLKRVSTARAAAINAVSCLRTAYGETDGYDIHINFPGGMPVDGPSAGLSMAVAARSAVTGRPVRGDIAMTGEISIQGRVLPVGGVREKIDAALYAGLSAVVIPAQNDCVRYHDLPISVVPVHTLSEALAFAFRPQPDAMIPPSGESAPSAPAMPPAAAKSSKGSAPLSAIK